MLIFFTILFFSSLILMIGMIMARFLYKKLHKEHFFHKVVIDKVRKVDKGLKKKVKKTRLMMRYLNKKTFTALAHFIIEEIEDHFHKGTNFVRSKLPHRK